MLASIDSVEYVELLMRRHSYSDVLGDHLTDSTRLELQERLDLINNKVDEITSVA